MIDSRALKSGVKAPLLLLPSHPTFRQSELVTLLGALEALYVVSDQGKDVNGWKHKYHKDKHRHTVIC